MDEAKAWKTPVDFVFILQPKDDFELLSLLKFNEFHFWIFYDKTIDFIRQNQLSSEPLYQTFLINPENKIVLAGNPLSNKTLWNLYKETEEKLRAFHDRWVIVSTENLIYNENQVT